MSAPKLEKADNGFWYAKWSENRRSKRKSMGTQDKVAAEREFAKWLLHRNAPVGDLPQRPTASDAWAVYDARKVQPSGRTDTADSSWKNLQPHFGHLEVGDIDQHTVDAYVVARAAGKIGRPSAKSTCRRELALLVAALNFCSKRPNQLYDPAILQPIVLPPAGAPRDRWLTMAEIQKMIDAAREMRRGGRLSRGERFLWLALETAARKSAILDLTWDRVDFEIGAIHYDAPGAARTSKRRVSVPMSKALRPILERAHAERENDLVMGSSSDTWALVKRMAARAGVDGVSPHVMRHTAATHMARNGVPLWTVAKVLGNSLAMVERVYAKWAPDDAKRNVDMISGGKLTLTEQPAAE